MRRDVFDSAFSFAAGGRALTRRDDFDFIFFRGWPILCGFWQRVGHSGWGGRDGWPGLLVMRRVPRPRFLRAGLGSRLSLSKTRIESLPPLSPSNSVDYADSVFRLRIFLDN